MAPLTWIYYYEITRSRAAGRSPLAQHSNIKTIVIVSITGMYAENSVRSSSPTCLEGTEIKVATKVLRMVASHVKNYPFGPW